MSRNDHLNHRPDEAGIEQIEKLRVKIIELDELLAEVVPPSRELSIAQTNLEQVRMWAVKGVALKYPAQEIGDHG